MKEEKITDMNNVRSENFFWKKKRLVTAVLALGVLCILASTILRLRRGRDVGVEIRPDKGYPVGAVAAFYQKDERWEGDKLGTSGYTMAGSGCLTSCIASALSTQYQNTGAGSAMTAGELNKMLSEHEVYNGQGDILWARLEEALPGVRVLVASSVKPQEIDELLTQGHYPLVKVKVGGSGAAHWVLLVGSEEGEYLCMDPLEESGKPIPLSRHGSVAYRMRCVYWDGIKE